ncbi:MAG: ornithine cyclodeaminase [Acidobacteria bacterium]|nr:MAG: ornithine cyclodeaminase [Acidobacteriota bacterium]PYU51567.1 MAG: ornithine cyclodeaminase [Acidobacteriota bacterium]PYU57346.1 MAG: ornithine cyclodeaminase [Acidobacteriota bacterium]PYU74892.1 MAG: ornithine cyclodeaminase [Acidobacteriota bacterium]
MTLHISEAEARAVLTMPMAVEAVEAISRKQATGEVVVHPRRRFELPGGGFFHYMAAADFSLGFVAMKQYTFVRGKLRFLVPIYEMSTGDLLALIEADYMGQLRTGAASGVATKYLARKDASVAAIIGTGGQAKTQLEAVATVRKLESARAYGRDAAKCEKFSEEMAKRLGIPVHICSSAAEAVHGADIVSTATTASQPVVFGANLSPGAHINAIGANHAHKRELDDEAVASADIIVVDSVEQSRQEAGDLIIAFHGDESCWTGVKKLSEIVAGKASGRTSDTEVTLFKSNGIASWDLAVAIKVYAMAREKGLGRELPLWSDGAKG